MGHLGNCCSSASLEVVAPIRVQLNRGPAWLVILRWTHVILAAAFVCVSIYAFSHHAFERHYVVLFILGPPLLLCLLALIKVAQAKQDLTALTPRSEV